MINPFTSAVEATATSSNAGYGVAWAAIIWGICYARKKKAIGGWLLLYLIQVFFGTAFWVFTTIMMRSSYIPASWPSFGRYLLFLVETVPFDIASVALFILSFNMISRTRRNWKTIILVQIALLITLCGSVISIIIGSLGENVALIVFDVWGAIWALAWLAYFVKSKRVRAVFQTKNWDSVVEKQPELVGGVLIVKDPDHSPQEEKQTCNGKIGSDDDLAIARLAVGNAVLKKGGYKKAAGEYSRALRINSSLVDAYYGLALCKAHMGKKEECLESLRNAVERGFNGWPMIENEKIFSQFADDPWFKILEEILRKRWDEAEGKKEDPGRDTTKS